MEGETTTNINIKFLGRIFRNIVLTLPLDFKRIPDCFSQ